LLKGLLLAKSMIQCHITMAITVEKMQGKLKIHLLITIYTSQARFTAITEKLSNLIGKMHQIAKAMQKELLRK